MTWLRSLLHPPKDGRAWLALVASVAGAAVLTALVAWIVWILWRGGWQAGTESDRIDALAKAMFGALATVAVVLLSLGLAINRRTFKGNFGSASFEASGGDEAAHGAQHVRQAADDAAEEVIQETKP